MDALGDYLKEAREKKGVTLEQVALQTKIQEHHLQALESEDFAELPAKVFAKGFVRSYAKVLGLDEEEAVQYFLQASGTFYEQSQPEQPHTQVKLEAAAQPKINWNLVVAVLAIIAAGIFWYGLPKQQETPIAVSQQQTSSPVEQREEPILPLSDPINSSEPVPIDTAPPLPNPPIPVPALPQPKPSPPIPTTQTQPTQAPVTPIPPTPIPTTPPAQSTKNTPGETSHNLEIEATQLTWVVVKSDEQDSNEALLQPGQRITWKAENQFLITLGNAAGVVIRLNGQPQGPFGKPGQVVRDIRLRP